MQSDLFWLLWDHAHTLWIYLKEIVLLTFRSSPLGVTGIKFSVNFWKCRLVATALLCPLEAEMCLLYPVEKVIYFMKYCLSLVYHYCTRFFQVFKVWFSIRVTTCKWVLHYLVVRNPWLPTIVTALILHVHVHCML